MLEFLRTIVLDPSAIVMTAGALGVAVIIFAESGILLGAFLPGDSLLFASGLIAANGVLNPFSLLALAVFAAILGDSAGYWIGRRTGEPLLRRYPRLVKAEHIHRTERFYERWGTRAVILARFVPIVRTITPPMAGISKMPYHRFVRANVIGAALWVPLMTGLGYFLGRTIPDAQHYLLPLSFSIVVISFIPFFVRMLKRKKAARA
ncbi:MAG TPA: DedA family protein [Candidatus Paceibacterota bacterium]